MKNTRSTRNSTRRRNVPVPDMAPVLEAVPEENQLESSPNVFTSVRWAWYLLALLVPFAGIFIALILYDQDSREVRKVGRNCLFIGFLIWVAFPVLLFLGLVLMGVLSAASWVSDAMPSAD